MRNDIKPMSEHLHRQRRGLIVTSVILCFMKYGGITINRISILGIEIQFANIHALYLFIWIIWLYFLIRYYQFFMQEGLMNIKLSYWDKFRELSRTKITKIVKDIYPRSVGGFDSYNWYNLEKINWRIRRYSGIEKIKKDPYANTEQFVFAMDISLFSLWKEILKSYYHVIVNRTVITDYVLPLAVAAFVFIYCNFIGDWTGSIINISF